MPAFLPEESKVLPVIMKTQMKWRDLLSYFRTWSSLHNYHVRFPDDLCSKDDPRFFLDDAAASRRDGSQGELPSTR